MGKVAPDERFDDESVRTPDTKWLGPAIGRARKRCGLCGAWCDRTVPGPVHERAVRLTCSGCGFEFDEPVVWTPQPVGPHDPHVGLPLRHQRSFRGNTIWAYNREHLTFLLSFVRSTHRHREPNANSTLVSQLPQWMKSAKNRPALVAALESMLVTATEPRRTPPTDDPPAGRRAAG